MTDILREEIEKASEYAAEMSRLSMDENGTYPDFWLGYEDACKALLKGHFRKPNNDSHEGNE